VKAELKALDPINRKRKWTEQGAPSKSVNKKKSDPAPPKSRHARLAEPYGKCGRTNHMTLECQVGTNKYLWCGGQSTSLLPVLEDRRL